MTEGKRQRTIITRDVLQQARAQLQKMAETRNPDAAMPKRVTPPGLIRALRAEIAAILKQGYDVEDMLPILHEHGISIDARTLKEYWRQTRRRGSRPRNARPT